MKNKIGQCREDKIFNAVNMTLLSIGVIAILYPIYFTVIASLSEPEYVSAGKVWLYPRGITLEGYAEMIRHSTIWLGYRNTLFYTIFGTCINLLITLPAAYSLSKKEFMPRNVIMIIIVFTMFFNGGLIPTYILVLKLGMINTIWAMVIPNAAGVFHIIIARTYFIVNIPRELEDAAFIDGCSTTRFFIKIALPISKAIIAAIILFYSVGHWNAFFNGLIYLRDEKLFPLQIFLREILVTNQMASMLKDTDDMYQRIRTYELIKYAVIIVSSLPMLIMYPLLQKHFIKGVMLGSLKG